LTLRGLTPVPEFDAGRTLADRMRAHAGHSTHLYGELMRSMADDWEAGGPVRAICAGWEDAPEGAVVQLRLLAGLFRIVLTGGAPELVPYYPCLGGTAPAAEAWPRVRPVLAASVAPLRAALQVAPQTNEVGRSTALLVGLFEAVRRTGLTQIRLLEPGASAGLNLLVDLFRFEEAAWCFGPTSSPVVLRNGVVGRVEPRDFTIVARRGCDLAPVDASTAEGQLRLRSFVWPFHLERHDRLTAALALAADVSVDVDAAPASRWLREQLAVPMASDVLTVVWHSVTRLYWPPEEIRAVEDAVADARKRHAVANVAMEFPSVDRQRRADLTLGALPGLDEPLRLATVGDHGQPVRMLDV
jgi:hypothetical protein